MFACAAPLWRPHSNPTEQIPLNSRARPSAARSPATRIDRATLTTIASTPPIVALIAGVVAAFLLLPNAVVANASGALAGDLPCQTYTYTGSTNTTADVAGIATDGDYAYVATIDGLFSIYRIAPDSDFILEGVTTYPGGRALRDVAVSGDVCFLLDRTELWVIDVTAKTSPELAATVQLPMECLEFAVMDDMLWLIGDALIGFDVREPTQPRLVAQSARIDGNRIDQDGRYLYVGGRNRLLRVVDVTRPSLPLEIMNVSHRVAFLQVVGDRLFVVEDGEDHYWRLVEYDIAHPGRIAGQVPHYGLRLGRMAATDEFMILGGRGTLLDLRDGQARVVSLDLGRFDRVAASGAVAIGASYNRLYAYQLDALPDNEPFFNGSLLGSGVTSLVATPYGLYAGANPSQVVLVDPTSLRALTVVPLAGVRDLATVDLPPLLFAAGPEGISTFFVEISRIVHRGDVATEGSAIQMAVSDPYVYVLTAPDPETRMIEVFELQGVTLIPRRAIEVNAGATALFAGNDWLALAVDTVLEFYDAEAPENPILMGSMQFPRAIYAGGTKDDAGEGALAVIHGTHIREGETTLEFIDVSELSAPQSIHSLTFFGSPRELAWSGETLYVATDASMQVIEAGDVPSARILAAVGHTPLQLHDVFQHVAADETGVLATSSTTILRLPARCPDVERGDHEAEPPLAAGALQPAPFMSRVTPNPLRADQALRFELVVPDASVGGLSIGLYDVHGRLVERLMDQTALEPGVRAFTWSLAGRRFPSGVYWLRLTTPSGAGSTAKVTILR